MASCICGTNQLIKLYIVYLPVRLVVDIFIKAVNLTTILTIISTFYASASFHFSKILIQFCWYSQLISGTGVQNLSNVASVQRIRSIREILPWLHTPNWQIWSVMDHIFRTLVADPHLTNAAIPLF